MTQVRKTLPNGMSVYGINHNEIDFLYREIFEDELYAPQGLSLPDDAVVFDVGANIGMFSLFAATRWPGARIFAFEPAREVFDALRRNVAHLPNVKVFNTAIGDVNGVKEITYYPHYTLMSGFDADPEADRELVRSFVGNVSAELSEPDGRELVGGAAELVDWRFREYERIPCAIRRIDAVAADYGIGRIDLLKVDVEGFEIKVLEGVGERLWPAVGHAAVEVEDDGGSLAAARELLERHGLRVTVDQAAGFGGTHVYDLFAARG